MPADSSIDASGHQERLGDDAQDIGVEVGVQQPRQLQPGLVDHVAMLGGRPIRPRVVLLPQMPAERPPWASVEQLPQVSLTEVRLLNFALAHWPRLHGSAVDDAPDGHEIGTS